MSRAGTKLVLSDYCPNNGAYSGCQSHRERAPKGDAHYRLEKFSATGSGAEQPRRARNTSEPIETIGIRKVDGASSTRARGAVAPTENVAADVRRPVPAALMWFQKYQAHLARERPERPWP